MNLLLIDENNSIKAKAGIIRSSDLYAWEVKLNENERKGGNHQGTKCLPK